MARPVAPKSALSLKNGSSKKPRLLSQLCGWEVENTALELDIEAWESLQEQLQERKEKLKVLPETSAFKHVPRHRCSGLNDVSSFEKYSLHESFYKPEVVPKTDNSKTEVESVSAPNTYRRAPLNVLTQGSANYHEWVRQQSRDDTDVTNRKRQPMETQNARSRSVSASLLVTSDPSDRPSPTMRRMMFYARKYAAKEDQMSNVDESHEDDEGYGSKTPSEEKDMIKFNDSTSTCFVSSWNGSSVPYGRHSESTLGPGSSVLYGRHSESTLGPGSSVPYGRHSESTVGSVVASTVGKFTYTHHSMPSRSQVYDESEDDDATHTSIEPIEPPRDFIIHHYGHRPRVPTIAKSNQPEVKPAAQPPTAATINYAQNCSRNIEDLKPVTMILRKITIQDSKEETKDSVSKEPEAKPEAMFDLQTSIAKPYMNAHEQSDRANYPLACTSPDLKFSQTNRPQSKASNKSRLDTPTLRTKSKLPVESVRKSPNDILKRSHIPLFDLTRANTSVCLPIGDLLPVMDKSIHAKASSARAEPPETGSKPEGDLTPRIALLDDPSLDIYSPRKNNMLGSPFRASNTTDKNNSKGKPLLDTSNKENGLGLPENKMKAPCGPVSGRDVQKSGSELWRRKKAEMNLLNAETLFKTTSGLLLPPSIFKRASDIPMSSSPGVAVTNLGFDIKHKLKYVLQRSNTMGTLKITTPYERETKKKIREAFNKFYQRKSSDLDGQSNYKYTWKT